MRVLRLGALAVLLMAAILACAPSRDNSQTLKESPGVSQPSPTASERPGAGTDADRKSILEVVDSFYAKYDSCMRRPPSQAAGQVSVYCQNNSGLTTAAFASNLEKGGTAKAGGDPITCSQNPPESVTVNTDTQISDNRATTSVSEKLGPTQIKVQVGLAREDKTWKVDNVTCPKP